MKSIPELFREQAEQTPDNIAISFRDTAITYRDLGRRADEVARRLQALGVGPDVKVALYLERSVELVVAMLGVLMAGGAYVPLDPLHPRQRLAYIMEDADPLAMLTQERLQAEAPAHNSQVLLMDPGATWPGLEPGPGAIHTPRPHDLAYVIYTSGSTGAPKGVEIEHCAVVNLLASMQRRPGFGADDTLLAITTPAFDISVLEIFLPLVSGARVVIAPTETVGDGAALIRLIARSNPTVLQATPSTMRMLLDAGWAGAPGLKLLCGGEAWSAELASRLLPRCASLWNMYGPTETTVWSAVGKVEPGQPVVIGPPIANTRLYVLDGALQLVPVGVTGELFIGGDGLARGYLNRSELTRERFLPDPFATTAGARMYRTGDRVRRLPDGGLEFLGRLDHQVKIRGHRVELGEIEAALQSHPAVERSVVVPREDSYGDQHLIAYVIPAPGRAISAVELRGALGEALPAYMVPSRYIPLASFPMTPNGKLDRNALPSPDKAGGQADTPSERPLTPTEAVLERIWREMLNLEHVGLNQNFFDLGGHSLLATRVIGRINQALKVRLPVPTFFQNPTIEALAAHLAQGQPTRPEPRLLQLRHGPKGLPLCFIGAGPAEIQIAQLMSAGRPIYGIDIPIPVEWSEALHSEDVGQFLTIRELGELHAKILLEHAGSMAVVVAGYSMWGRIAVEAARAIQRDGGTVAFVLLLDARRVTSSGTGWGAGAESLRWIWRNATSDSGGDIARGGRIITGIGHSLQLSRWLVTRIPQYVRNRFVPKGRLSGYLDSEGAPVRQIVIDRLNHAIDDTYKPEPLDAPGVLLRARFAGDQTLPGYDITNGWRGLFSKGLEIVEADGDHHSMLREENLARAAQLIDSVLDRHEVAGRRPRSEALDRTSRAEAFG